MFMGADVEAACPVIEAMGELRKVGTCGNGYVAKLVNNQLLADIATPGLRGHYKALPVSRK